MTKRWFSPDDEALALFALRCVKFIGLSCFSFSGVTKLASLAHATSLCRREAGAVAGDVLVHAVNAFKHRARLQ